MPVVVEILRPGRAPEIREFGENRITVGRDVGTIALQDPQASARHAEITLTPRGVLFRDLGSTNGSFTDAGQRLGEAFVWQPGVKVLIGNSALVLISSAMPSFGPMGTLVLPGKSSKSSSGMSEPRMSAISVPATTVPPTQPMGSGALEPRLAGGPMQVAAPIVDVLPRAGVGPGASGPEPVAEQPSSKEQPGPKQQPALHEVLGPGAGAFAPPAQPGVAQPGVAQGVLGPSGSALPALVLPFAQPSGVLPLLTDDVNLTSGSAVQALAEAPPRPGFTQSKEGPGCFEFLRGSWQEYRPYALDGFRVLGLLVVPVALLSAASEGNNMLRVLLLPITSFGYAVVFFLFGLGAQAEFALRAYAGLPVSVKAVWDIQSRRLITWPVELLLPVLITMAGLVVTFVAFAPMLLPVYMIEREGGVKINKRSFALVVSDATTSLFPLLIIAISGTALLVTITAALESVPRFGAQLAALFAPTAIAGFMPFISFLQFRAYGEIRRRQEGVDVRELIRRR